MRVIEGRPQASRYASPGAYEHYLRAKLLAGRGDVSSATHELKRALAFDAGSPFLHTELAELLAAAGQNSAAAAELKRALELAPRFPDAWRVRGDLARRRGQTALARRSYDQCIAAAPQSPKCYLRQAALLDHAELPQQARAVVQGLITRSSGRSGHRALARLCAQQMQLDCAAQHFAAALGQRRDLASLVMAARVQRARGQFAEAATLLGVAYEGTRDTQIEEALVGTLVQLERHEAIAELVEGLLTRYPRSSAQRVAAARLLLRHGLAQKALEVDAGFPPKTEPPDAPARLLLRAEALTQLRRTEEALTLVDRASAVRHRSAETILWSAHLLSRLDRRPRAVADLEGLIAREPGRLDARLMLAQLHSELGQWKQAIDTLQQAPASQRAGSLLQMGLAAALHRAGRWKEALGVARGVARKDPLNASAHNFVGYVLADRKIELKEARRAIDHALRISPLTPHIVDSLGWLHLRQGRIPAALTVLGMAARLAPRDAEVLAHLAEAHRLQGDADQAAALLTKALDLCTDPHSCKLWKETVRRLKATRHEADQI